MKDSDMNGMLTERQAEWDQMGEERAKRRRPTTEGSSQVAKGRDCFDEVLQEGYGNGQIRNSWLTSVRQISSTSYVPDNGENQSPVGELDFKLLQVKRRLWPSSERCAHACRSSPFEEYEEARKICNPMEPLGEGRNNGLNQMFMNRSAVKIANIDAMLDFSLTKTAVPTDHFFFVDLCGAPGGFSEYLMKRCQQTRHVGSCRGYGMSLKGANGHGNGIRWKLGDTAETYGSFHTSYHVSGGKDGSGDIYRWSNVIGLCDGIQYDMQSAGIPPQKVHLVVADGGFDAQRNSECQEEISQKLVICEVAAGLHLLQPGGKLVVKMFGFQTNTIRTTMRYLYDLFEGITAVKPVSSRPASAERYVICTGFRGLPNGWEGPAWMSRVLLGQSTNSDAQYWSLDRYLDEFDRDMLTLNLRACFAILSYLDGKANSGSSGLWPRPKVDVESYREAWRLN